MQLKMLLVEFQDVFTKHDFDIEFLTAIQHRIDTKDANPVKHKMCRPSLGFQHQEEEHLRKMMQAGIIRPSSSEWASSPPEEKRWKS